MGFHERYGEKDSTQEVVGRPVDAEMVALETVWDAVKNLHPEALYRVTSYVEKRHNSEWLKMKETAPPAV